MENPNCEMLEDFKRLNPVQRLWVSVLIISIKDLHQNRDGRGFALNWITDTGNIFFDFASESLGVDPECLRHAIFKMLKKEL